LSRRLPYDRAAVVVQCGPRARCWAEAYAVRGAGLRPTPCAVLG